MTKTFGFSKDFWAHLGNCLRGFASPSELYAIRPNDFNESDGLVTVIDGLRLRRKEMEASTNRSKSEFAVRFCGRVEALLSLLHIRPIIVLVGNDNTALRNDAKQGFGHGRNALLETVELPKERTVNHLEDVAWLIKGTLHFGEEYDYPNRPGIALTQQSTMAELVEEIDKMSRWS